MERIATGYRYYISIIDMMNMLARLEYEPDSMYIQNGRWIVPLPSTYADVIIHAQSSTHFSGIGFFKDFANIPSVVVNVEKQQVYILDERHIRKIKEKTGKNMISVTVTFDRVFGDSATWEALVNEIA